MEKQHLFPSLSWVSGREMGERHPVTAENLPSSHVEEQCLQTVQKWSDGCLTMRSKGFLD